MRVRVHVCVCVRVRVCERMCVVPLCESARYFLWKLHLCAAVEINSGHNVLLVQFISAKINEWLNKRVDGWDCAAPLLTLTHALASAHTRMNFVKRMLAVCVYSPIFSISPMQQNPMRSCLLRWSRPSQLIHLAANVCVCALKQVSFIS